MRKIIYSLALLGIMGCKSRQLMDPVTPQHVEVTLDLVNVENDKVQVTIDPGPFTTEETTFYLPKTVPGTYSIDNYGKFIEDLKAFDYLGKELLVAKINDNSWFVDNATHLDKITYFVNDSFDIHGEEGVFSPSGTNIEKGENFLLNLHGFVGYFHDLQEEPYKLIIKRPENLIPGTAMQVTNSMSHEEDPAIVTDAFILSRYFEVIDNPVMYATTDTSYVNVEGMKVLINVYSPNKIYSSKTILPEVEKMISAQKRFLGDIDNTSNYAILLYLSDPEEIDARGFGALEHHTSTVVVLPENMPLESLTQTMTDVVSHEFFHILTPLNVHSKEIHYFDYNDPEMSQHLWMYEGVTEYFSHLFQVNQGLISNQEFYDRISEKIEGSKNYNDTIPFTLLSENILESPYNEDFYNVYLKGALIGMALDIRLRELSGGKRGILDLMKDLSAKYGKDKPFNDDELIPEMVKMTYPQIGEFFSTYVTGNSPIPYEDFLNKVGVEIAEIQVPASFFIKGQVPYIDGDPATGELFFRENMRLNSFLNELGVKNGDLIKSVNGTEYNVQNVYDLVMNSQNWEEEDDISMVVIREGEETELKGKISQPTDMETKIVEISLSDNDPRVKLRKAWLRD